MENEKEAKKILKQCGLTPDNIQRFAEDMAAKACSTASDGAWAQCKVNPKECYSAVLEDVKQRIDRELKEVKKLIK